MNDPIRLGLVGCGWISESHAIGFKELVQRGCKDIQYTACCDPNQDNARKRAKELAEIQGFEPQVFPDVAALLRAKAADAADICLPHYLHHTVGIEAMEGGLHVMIEKPLGITMKAGRRIIETARRTKRVLATAENIRRSLSSRACAWAVRDGELIGDVKAAHITFMTHAPFDYAIPAWKWRGVKLLNGGGMLLDGGTHFFDMQRVLFGEVDEVSCTLANYDQRIIPNAPVFGDVRPDVEDTWHVDVRFESGMQLTWTYSRAFPGSTVRAAHYFGSEGTLEDLGWLFHPFEGGGKITFAGDKTMSKDEIEKEYLLALRDEPKARLFPYGCTHHVGVEIWDFADAIRSGRTPEIDGEEGQRIKAICEACYESALCGCPVKCDDVLSGKLCAYQQPIDEYWKI